MLHVLHGSTPWSSSSDITGWRFSSLINFDLDGTMLVDNIEDANRSRNF